MNDLEDDLKSLSLSAPSPELDRRLDAAFTAAQPKPQAGGLLLVWSVATWLAAAAAITLAMLRPTERAPVDPVLIYRFRAEGKLRHLLIDPPATQTTGPVFKFSSSSS